MNKTIDFFVSLSLILLVGTSPALAQTSSETKSVTEDVTKPFVIEQPATLETPTGKIHGTILLPIGKAPFRVVLIIAGSGPTDRDGNSTLLPGSNNSLKMLAEGLAANGIASLRFDKRGIGESAAALGSEADLRFENYIDDAVLWCKQLRSDNRFSTITIAGHSEGSLIGMVAARDNNADAYVSIAGIGRSAGSVILDQLRPQLPPDLMKTAEDIMATLTEGKRPESVPAQLNSLFRPSVQPYMISWLRYVPINEIAKLSTPVLIIQGTTDIQVGVEQADLLAQAKPAASLFFIEGMNHVLKVVPDDAAKQVASYSDPSLPLAPHLIDRMVKFVNEAQKKED